LGQKNIALAEKHAKAAVDADPRSNFASTTLGRVQFAQKLYMLGFESLKKAAQLTTGPAPFLFDPAKELSTAKELSGRTFESESGWLFTEIVKRDPSNLAAWNELLSLLKVTGEISDTRDHLGPAYSRLTPEQRRTFDGIPAIDRRPSNPTNGQQIPRQQSVRMP
jgi:hypothetical protein